MSKIKTAALWLFKAALWIIGLLIVIRAAESYGPIAWLFVYVGLVWWHLTLQMANLESLIKGAYEGINAIRFATDHRRDR